MSPAVVGFLRGILSVVVFAVVGYVANATNLSPLVGGSLATVIAGIAVAIEHAMSPSGTAMFGAVSARQ